MVDTDFPKLWLLLWKLRFYHWQQNCQLFSLKWQTYFVHFWEERLPNAWIAIVWQFPFHSKSKWCSLKKSLQLGCTTSFCICPELDVFFIIWATREAWVVPGTHHPLEGYRGSGAVVQRAGVCVCIKGFPEAFWRSKYTLLVKRKNPPNTVDSIHQTLCKWTLLPSA